MTCAEAARAVGDLLSRREKLMRKNYSAQKKKKESLRVMNKLPRRSASCSTQTRPHPYCGGYWADSGENKSGNFIDQANSIFFFFLEGAVVELLNVIIHHKGKTSVNSVPDVVHQEEVYHRWA